MDPLLGRETSCFESPCSGFADLGSISVHSKNYECPGLQTLVVLVEPPFVCAKLVFLFHALLLLSKHK